MVDLVDGVDDVEEYIGEEPETEVNCEKGRDKRLLQALFNGDAISAVYDHSHFEDKKLDKAARFRLENGAQQIVDGTLASTLLIPIRMI